MKALHLVMKIRTGWVPEKLVRLSRVDKEVHSYIVNH